MNGVNAGSPFLTAARDGDIEKLKVLLEDPNLDLEQRDDGEYGFTALMLAALNNNLEVLSLLLDKGAKIDATDGFGNTALMQAYTKECAALLIERCANLKLKNKFGQTAQSRAKELRDPELAQFLKAESEKNDKGLKLVFDKVADFHEDRMSDVGMALGTSCGYGIAVAAGVPLGGVFAVGFVAALPAAGIMLATGLAVSFGVVAAKKLFSKKKTTAQPKL